MSCTGRPRIPPALFTRSSHHSVERSPAAPTGAAIPARIVSTPIFTGPPACANTGAASRRTVAAAAPAPMSLSKLRRVVLMASSLRVRASFPAAFYHTSARAWLGEVVEAEIEPVQAGGSMIVVDFAMQVRFWGTRGSIATPGAATAVYGGNTSCTEVRAADGTVIVLDCGTGVRGLGLHLVRTMPQPMRLHLFIGHTHWDHIQGFPFFIPAFLPGAELNIYAPRGFQRSLEEAMSGQMEYSYFPVKLRELRSRIHYTELDEGFFRVGEVRVETQYLNHTGPTIGYRLSSGGGPPATWRPPPSCSTGRSRAGACWSAAATTRRSPRSRRSSARMPSACSALRTCHPCSGGGPISGRTWRSSTARCSTARAQALST